IFTAAGEAAEIAYTATPTGTGTEEKRLLARSRTRYLKDDLSAPLAFGSVESKALPYDSESMAMTDDQRDAVFGSLTGAPTNPSSPTRAATSTTPPPTAGGSARGIRPTT